MTRQLNLLSSKFVETTTEPGRYSDGGGLYLQVSAGKNGGVTKSWLFRYMRGHVSSTGKPLSREMGIGPLSTNKRDGLITMKDARDRAYKARLDLKAGIDPLDVKSAKRFAEKLATARAMTFEQCGEQYIKDHAAGWKGQKHEKDWRGSLKRYAYPVIGCLPVSAVDTGLVVKVLKPIWETKTKTAVDVRSRIELILNWAKLHGFRDGENPARWKGHLDHALPKPSKVSKVNHHEAMPYEALPSFMVELCTKTVKGAAPLEWAILAAVRSEESLGAEWSEIDTVKRVWTIPAARMKAEADHRMPITDRMLEILQGLPRAGKFVFPGRTPEKKLSTAVMWQLLQAMRPKSSFTVHGFRSAFRDWAAEQTGYANHVVEMALAHTIGDAVEAAYRRGDLFEKRRALMADWAEYCSAVQK
jgi:integrase